MANTPMPINEMAFTVSVMTVAFWARSRFSRFLEFSEPDDTTGASPAPHHVLRRIKGGAMSTIENAQLASDPGPNEREKIERLIAKIETALTLLEPNDPLDQGE